MISEKRLSATYAVCDYLFANIAWTLFTITRFYLTRDSEELSAVASVTDYMAYPDVAAGQVYFPLLMVGIFYLSGYYNRGTVFFRSRLQEFLTTLSSTFTTAILLYFIILINDNFPERNRNYELIATMWGIIFIMVYLPRAIITNNIAKKIERGLIYFNTVVIGVNKSAVALIDSLRNSRRPTGYRIVGLIPFNGETPGPWLPGELPVYQPSDINRVCGEQNVQTIIIVPESRSNKEVLHSVNQLFRLNIPIKLAPKMYDILTSNVKHANIIGEPLVNIAQSNMPEWQKNVKRAADVACSAVALVCLSPVFAVLALMIKKDSPGPVFYKQERIGRRGRTFFIYKFRTMVADAEGDGTPRLTADNDSRITRVGRFMRKYRLDETPQFWNVIKGDMSMVGPRPERKYFAEKIIERAPYYTLTYQIRPGITSWGMVKFGYAQTVDEMIERSKYDLIYLENMSLFVDMKIIIYTIRTVLTGKGI